MPEVLCCGQVANLAAPSGGAAELYYLADEGYGAPVATDTPLLIETDDVTPAGPSGICLVRRVEVPIRCDGTAAVRVTVICDFSREVAQVTHTYDSPSMDVAVIEVAQRTTAIRARIEVTARTGRVTISQPEVVARVLTGTAAEIVETV